MELLTVIAAKYISGYVLKLSFSNGEEKEVDLSSKLDLPVFEPLKDVGYFKKFKLNSFTVKWNSGADFDPQYLYDLASMQENTEKVKEEEVG